MYSRLIYVSHDFFPSADNVAGTLYAGATAGGNTGASASLSGSANHGVGIGHAEAHSGGIHKQVIETVSTNEQIPAVEVEPEKTDVAVETEPEQVNVAVESDSEKTEIQSDESDAKTEVESEKPEVVNTNVAVEPELTSTSSLAPETTVTKFPHSTTNQIQMFDQNNNPVTNSLLIKKNR